MPLVSHKGALAIAAVIDIAVYSTTGPVCAKALATRHKLPPRHLEGHSWSARRLRGRA